MKKKKRPPKLIYRSDALVQMEKHRSAAETIEAGIRRNRRECGLSEEDPKNDEERIKYNERLLNRSRR